MASDWIKFEHTTPDKPEVVEMASALHMDQDAVVGKLLRIWIWADQNSISGTTKGITDAFIDRLTCKRGFASAMRAVGWMTGEGNQITFSNFQRNNGASAKARAMENRKKAALRKSEKCPENVPVSSGQIEGQKWGPEKRREEKSINTNTAPTAPADAAASVPVAPPAPVPRERNPLFDALAEAEGSKTAELTKPAARAIAVALAQIKQVCPELKAEEIHRRAENYRASMPGTLLTATALAKHWSRMDDPPLRFAGGRPELGGALMR